MEVNKKLLKALPPSGPKNITVDSVIRSLPFLNQVNHADMTVTPSAIDEITMGIQPFI
jgi:hypothetical protein